MSENEQFERLLLVGALVALVVLAGCAGGGSEAQSTGTGAPPADDGGREAGGGSDEQATANSYYGAENRVVVRSASMEVRVKQFGKQFRKARAAARRHGGFVTDYDIRSQGDWQRATFTVRVPARNFSDARDALADLGTLESESVSAKDFTNEHRQRRGELAELRERERTLEGRLADTDNESKRHRIRTDLRTVRDRIDELEAKQAALDRKETLSSITVTMHEPVTEKPPANHRSAQGFGDSLLLGFYGGLGILKGVVVLTGYLVSLGLSALVLGLLGMVFLAIGLATWQRGWPLFRDLFGIERRTPQDVSPREGAPAPEPREGPDREE